MKTLLRSCHMYITYMFRNKIGTISFLRWIKDATLLFRREGFKGLFKIYGWRLLIAFTLYYLIRDVTLYIAIPYLVAKGLFS